MHEVLKDWISQFDRDQFGFKAVGGMAGLSTIIDRNRSKADMASFVRKFLFTRAVN